jgi:hypothetical protein
MTINKTEFRKFLEENLKLGKAGFDNFTYDFNAYLADAECNLAIGNSSYELSARETVTGQPECFDFN